MSTSGGREPPVMYLVVCGAGPVTDIGYLILRVRRRGWRPCVIATPSAARILDLSDLERQTELPVRTDHRKLHERRETLPRANAVIVAPASFNTINKWAQGIADTYALDILAESTNYGVPIVAVPFVNTSLANRAPFRRSIAQLREEGVAVIFGPGQWEPHLPGKGTERVDEFPWNLALDRAIGSSAETGIP